jgi:lauroyl/myristoyl acyltransferase
MQMRRPPAILTERPDYPAAPSCLAAVRGKVAWWLSRGSAPTLRELDLGLGQEKSRRELRRLGRLHFQFLERERLARVWPLIRGFAGGEAIVVEGRRHLDEALAAGRGAIVASSHFGYPRLIKPILRSRGYPALLVGMPRQRGRRADVTLARPFTRPGLLVYARWLRLPRASAYDESWRRAVGEDLPAEINLRPHLRALGRNEVLVVLADGRAGQALQPISVLGCDVPFAPGTISIARAAGAPVLPAFVIDDPHSRDPMGARFVILPPLDLQSTGDGKVDPIASLQSFAAVLEEQVRAAPHLWSHWSLEWRKQKYAGLWAPRERA